MPSVTNIGTAGGKSATTQTISATVPAGALIVVCTAQIGAITGFTVSDPVNGTYTSAVASTTNNALATIWYKFNAGALSAQNISVGSATAGTFEASAFFATGVQTSADPLDRTGNATGTSTTPSVSTSAGTTATGELLVGAVASNGPVADTFTQDGTNEGGFSTPPTRAGTTGGGAATNEVIAGGTVATWNSSGTATYAPTITSRLWGAVIATFKAGPLTSGWEIPPFQPPSVALSVSRRYPAIKGRSGFAAFPDLLPIGWMTPPPFQPPHLRPERAAAIMVGDQGTEAKLVTVTVPQGWQIPPFQPPNPQNRVDDAGAITWGDQGTQAPFIQFLQNDWDLHPFQPPHPRPEQRYAAMVQRDEGIEFPFIRFFPYGWEIAPFQPDEPPTPVGRNAAIMVGDQGTQSPFIRFFPYGWEIPSPQPRHPRPEAAGAIMPSEPGVEAQLVVKAIQWGWEGPSWASRYTPNAKMVPDGGDQGTQAQFIRWINGGWEIPPPLTRDQVFKNPEIGDQGTQAQFINWLNAGWEIAPPQPPHPRPERSASWMVGDQGTQAVYVPPAKLLWGWQIPPPDLKQLASKGAALYGSADFISFAFQPYNWEIPQWQPPRPRPEKSGAIATSEPGIEAQLVSKPIIWGWDVPPFQPPALNYRLNSAAFKVLGSIETPPFTFQPSGWEIPPPLTRDQVFKSPEIGDQGTQASFINWVNFNWEIPSFQPPHPRVEKAGAIMPSEPGIENKFVFTPIIWGWDIAAPFVRYRFLKSPEVGDQGIQAQFINWVNYNWIIPPFQPSHPRPERAGAIMPSEPGIEAVYVPSAPILWSWEQPASHLRQPITRYFGIEGTSDFASFTFQPYGWEIAPFQPPHPRPERGAPTITSEPGIEAVYVPPVIFREGWQIPPFQPPALSQALNRFAAMVRGQDGTEFPLIRFFPSGWEIAPHQPQHPRPERAGAIMPWDTGTENIFIPPPFVTDAWEIQAWQPPHPRPERAGAIMRGDDGIQSPFVRWLNAGWEIPSFQPPHRAPEWKAASLFKGDDGIQAPFTLFLPNDWDLHPFQPPHRGQEWKAAALFRGDEGIQAQFVRWFNMGWEIPPYQPPHPRPERAGSIMVGHQGTDAPYVFVPLGSLFKFDPRFITWGEKRVYVTGSPRTAVTYDVGRKSVTVPQ